MKKKQKITLYRIIITAVMLVVLQFLPITGIPRLIAYLAAYLVIGYDILRKAGKGILNGRAFDENFLMALATLGAFFLAIWTKSGDYLEGIAVMLFYQIGELFQSYAVGKSRKNISALMEKSRSTAWSKAATQALIPARSPAKASRAMSKRAMRSSAAASI